MNNKGFTLVELLAVIIILLGISVVSVVSITSSLERNKARECDSQKELIINAAKVYLSLYDNDKKVKIKDLVNSGYLKKDSVTRYDENAEIRKIDDGYSFTANCN